MPPIARATCRVLFAGLLSTGSVNAHAVASIFGGGGHRTRAGCALTGPIEINMERVLAEALRQFDEA